MLDLLELETWVVEGCLMWEIVTELRFSVMAVLALNHWAILQSSL